MDIATVVGFVLIYAFVLFGILGAGSVSSFIDMPSALITIGGAMAATVMRFPLGTTLGASKVVMKTIFAKIATPKETIDEIVVLAETARKESILALERVEVGNLFLKKGIRMAVDGKDPDTIKSIMNIDLDAMAERHEEGKMWIDSVGEMAPAYGMIGTLMGLVIMLGNLDDPTTVGPSMAIALITTFYGSLLANSFSLPMSTKLALRSKEEARAMRIIIAGVLSILAGENPRVIREKLESFLPPSQRSSDDDFGGGEAEAA